MPDGKASSAIAWQDNPAALAEAAPFPDPALPDDVIAAEVAQCLNGPLLHDCVAGVAANIRLLRDHYLTLAGRRR
ncbi:MAG: hypothetical protein AB7D33_12815 [Sphingobium sp.]